MENKRLCFRWAEKILFNLSISPKYNTNLKYEGKEIEAGNFYEFQAYNLIPENLGPFCLNKARIM